ncbi:uncharacterized protein N7477_000267 [Penicillium maclennaniae]|uniref:uncharacterized protein n=1 Tax=Penicillium maclennaniae TaxID=1343394 RepID=UPI002542453A|nr:uncharacterized protein N7477_000267 [Penicillium maclennaniae]KAJ5683922.1 hypothetical protein N7477_000267 [Penicillium maclennaniae]
MSLDSVTSGLGKGLPVNQVTDKATGSAQTLASDPVKGVSDTTKTVGDTSKKVTEPLVPGEFPADDAAEKKYQGEQPEVNFTALWTSFSQWVAELFPQAVDLFEYVVQWVVNRYFPPPKQAAMYEAMLKRPIASTFLICQAICCGVPLLVFLVGVFLFAVVSVILWALLSLLILGPILLVASMMGISLWGWGWILYGLIKWVDQMFLGGMITRFWLGKSPEQVEAEADAQAEAESEAAPEAEKKDN